jgi:PAS domain S-box-containing protein
MEPLLILLTSPFYLAAIGALVAICVVGLHKSRTPRWRSRLEPDVPRRDVAIGRRWNYSEILEYTHDAILIWEMGGKGIVYWNSAAERIYGYSKSQAIGKTTHGLLQTRLDGGVSQLEAKLARYGVWAGELRHTTCSGAEIVVQSRLALMSQHNGRWLVLEINRDAWPAYREAEVQQAVQAHLQSLRCERAQSSTPALDASANSRGPRANE